MKILRIGIAALAITALVLLVGGTPQAFHTGGVAECSGCHSMHTPNARGSYLLIGSDASSTCLSCHMHLGDTGPSTYHIATATADMPVGTAPLQRTPGGDFGWLKKDYSYVPRTGAATEYQYGYTFGHNIVAADAGFVVDPVNASAPGGTGTAFSSANLGCESCHDPHGRARRLSDGSYVNAFYTQGSQNAPIYSAGSYGAVPTAGLAVGVYRLLRGLGDTSQGVTFSGVPIAVAPSTYNRTEAVTQTRVAYGSAGTNTWGNWCASCHQSMHSTMSSGSNYVHPVDVAMSSGVRDNYNNYVMTGDLRGSATSSFTSLVPFVEGTGAIATLAGHAKNNDTALGGPGNGDQVSCVTCHRSHASGFKYMLRWNMENEFMVFESLYAPASKLSVGQGRTETEMAGAYYDRPVTKFASYQRLLCNKCHAKD